MTRAIAALSGSAQAFLPPAFFAFWRSLLVEIFNPYRPERYYMRGPGPACKAKASAGG